MPVAVVDDGLDEMTFHDADFHALPPLPIDVVASNDKLLHPPDCDGKLMMTVGYNGVYGGFTDIVNIPAAIFFVQSDPAIHCARRISGTNDTDPPGTTVVGKLDTCTADVLTKEHVAEANPLNNFVQVKVLVEIPAISVATSNNTVTYAPLSLNIAIVIFGDGNGALDDIIVAVAVVI